MPDKRENDFDYVTSFLGDWGCFQIIMVLLSLRAMPSGYMGVITVFTSHTPEFRCKASVDSTNRSSRSGAENCSRRWTGTGRRALDSAMTRLRVVSGWMGLQQRDARLYDRDRGKNKSRTCRNTISTVRFAVGSSVWGSMECPVFHICFLAWLDWNFYLWWPLRSVKNVEFYFTLKKKSSSSLVKIYK